MGRSVANLQGGVMAVPRRWIIADYRQSDDVRVGVGKVVSGDEFTKYGEAVKVREDAVTDDDVEAVRAWVRVNPRQAFTAKNVREMLTLILGGFPPA